MSWLSARNKQRQQGVALILVLVILALVTLIATQLVTMRNLYSHRTYNIILSESAWGYVVGAEQLAKIALHQSLKNEDLVHADQPWATQTVEFSIDGGTLKASLSDLRSCFNINSILDGANDSEDMKQSALPGQKVFQRLLELLVVDQNVDMSALTSPVRDWLDADVVPNGFEGREDEEYTGYIQPYRTANQLINSVSELRVVSGFSDEVMTVILPYICAIPGDTQLVINVNTIAKDQPELLASFYENLSLDDAAQILSSRSQEGFSEAEFNPLLPADAKLVEGASIVFTSEYFAAYLQVELGTTKTKLKSLLFYDRAKPAVQLIARMGHND